MFLNLEELDHLETVDCDLCVIGAGPAGISIALQFAGSNTSVCLLESGGLKLDVAYQALCEGESIGLPYWRPLHEVRYRYFGGSTSRWGAWLAPLNNIDFGVRSWVPYSGWPISKAELDDYYVRAHELCCAGSYGYELQNLGLPEQYLPRFTPDALTHRLWRFGAPARFGKLYRKIIADAQNIKAILHASVLELETNGTATQVTGAKAVTLGRKGVTFRGRAFVLATGGLEVPRILLLSRRVQKSGLGNHNDLVGRFFMEHPHIDIATAYLNRNRTWVRHYQMGRIGRDIFRPKICLSEDYQRRHKLINCSCSIDIPDNDNTSYNSLRRLKKTIIDPFENDDMLRNLAAVFLNPTDVIYGLYCKFANIRYFPRKAPPGEVTLRARIEQVPNPQSRVVLSKQRDSVGAQRIKLDWQLDGLEKNSMRMLCLCLAKEFTRLGLGEVRPFEWLTTDGRDWPPALAGGPHHMGTTRMSDNSKQGVVDRNCRVHGVNNLYVAGSAVFPTGGYANPTLTIIALALRLADHLQHEYFRTD